MKKVLILSIAFLFASTIGFAQATNISSGTTVKYVANAGGGASVDFNVKIAAMDNDGIDLEYTVKQGAKSFNGKIFVTKKGWEKGSKLNWDDLAPNKEKQLNDDETSFMFSSDFYNALVKNNSAKYDNTTYTVKKIPAGQNIMLNGKPVDVIYVVSGATGAQYWVLKNPKLPLIMKITGNKTGPDFSLAGISKS